MDWCKSKCPKWPVTRKCCFCVPIRKGVFIFGYVNLVISLLAFSLLVFQLVKHLTSKRESDDEHISLEPIGDLSLAMALVIIDVVMTVVLLIGAHRNKEILLKVYFYFGVVLQLITLCVDLADFDYRDVIGNAVYFSVLGLNIYLLFLVYNTFYLIEKGSEVKYTAYREQDISLPS